MTEGQQGESRRSTKAGRALTVAAKVAMRESEVGSDAAGKPRLKNAF